MRWSFFNGNESAQTVARHETRAADLFALTAHLPAMRTTAEEVSQCATRLQMRHVNARLIHSWCELGALGDLHATAIAGLERGRDFGAIVLAREGIRLAVDAAYVLCDPEADRLAAALRRHVDGQRTRVADWRKASPDEALPGVVLARLEDLTVRSPWYDGAPAWPSLLPRAEAVGMASWIHPVFAGASDTSEVATQQFMDFLECEQGPASECSAGHTYRTARCMSDALYTESVSLLLFAHVLYLLAVELGDIVAKTVAESAKHRMEGILAEHGRIAEAHLDDRNVYVGFRFPGPAMS